MRKRIILILVVLVLAIAACLWMSFTSPDIPVETESMENVPPTSTIISAYAPEVPALADSPLKNSILAAGKYLVRQQLANGELPYQVNVLTNDRSSTPSYIRLMGGVGALYTVCRVADDASYCEVGDHAFEHYLPNLLTDPARFKGTCLYTNGACPLGGATITMDAIYKRWQATGTVLLEDRDLLATAVDIGYFIVSMRKPESGFYHSFDPHFAGTVNPGYFDPTFNGEGVAALIQLYEMTGNDFWLEQAREVNEFLLAQTVMEDNGHSYALALFARLGELSKADEKFGRHIADLVIAGQIRSLNPANSSISTATKIEALSALAQAFARDDLDHEWLDHEIKTFITFVQARQLPANDCNFELTKEMIENFKGGIFGSCEDPSIRVDGIQHWVNGLTMYLEYQSLAGSK